MAPGHLMDVGTPGKCQAGKCPPGWIGVPPSTPGPQSLLGLRQGDDREGLPHPPKLPRGHPLTRLLGFPPEAGEAGGSGTSFSVMLRGEETQMASAGAGPAAGARQGLKRSDPAGWAVPPLPSLSWRGLVLPGEAPGSLPPPIPQPLSRPGLVLSRRAPGPGWRRPVPSPERGTSADPGTRCQVL